MRSESFRLMEVDHNEASNGGGFQKSANTMVTTSTVERPLEAPGPAAMFGPQCIEPSSTSKPRPNYKLRYTMGGHTMSISSIKFSPDGSMLASAGMFPVSFIAVFIYLSPRKAADKHIKLWDAYAGQIIRTLEGHSEGISDVAWSNDSEYLASASDDKTIRIWKPDTVSSLNLNA